MDSDDAFLQAILRDPNDEPTRLVYADWLEERGDPQSLARGEFLRLDHELATRKHKKKSRAVVEARLGALRETIDIGWLIVFDRLPVENCRAHFEFQCPRRWEKLQATEDLRVRFCSACQQNVYHCDTEYDVWTHANQGHCIAVERHVSRQPNDLERRVFMRMGRAAVPRNPFIPGERIRIKKGVFAGMEGVVREWDSMQETVGVELILMARTTRVQFFFRDLEGLH
jgi:uncharacterized protein (TIGR02996 family)